MANNTSKKEKKNRIENFNEVLKKEDLHSTPLALPSNAKYMPPPAPLKEKKPWIKEFIDDFERPLAEDIRHLRKGTVHLNEHDMDFEL